MEYPSTSVCLRLLTISTSCFLQQVSRYRSYSYVYTGRPYYKPFYWPVFQSFPPFETNSTNSYRTCTPLHSWTNPISTRHCLRCQEIRFLYSHWILHSPWQFLAPLTLTCPVAKCSCRSDSLRALIICVSCWLQENLIIFLCLRFSTYLLHFCTSNTVMQKLVIDQQLKQTLQKCTLPCTAHMAQRLLQKEAFRPGLLQSILMTSLFTSLLIELDFSNLLGLVNLHSCLQSSPSRWKRRIMMFYIS